MTGPGLECRYRFVKRRHRAEARDRPDLENATRKPAEKPLALPSSLRAGKDHPRDYLPDRGLVDAIRAALLLRRPLLLTGEAGAGKTQAAH